MPKLNQIEWSNLYQWVWLFLIYLLIDVNFCKHTESRAPIRFVLLINAYIKVQLVIILLCPLDKIFDQVQPLDKILNLQLVWILVLGLVSVHWWVGQGYGHVVLVFGRRVPESGCFLWWESNKSPFLAMAEM